MLNTGVEVAIHERFRLGEATHMGANMVDMWANMVDMGAKMGAKKRVNFFADHSSTMQESSRGVFSMLESWDVKLSAHAII